MALTILGDNFGNLFGRVVYWSLSVVLRRSGSRGIGWLKFSGVQRISQEYKAYNKSDELPKALIGLSRVYISPVYRIFFSI